MPLPLLVSGPAFQRLGEGGLPSGLFHDATYEGHLVQLSPGDYILVATDGLHELCNEEGIEFYTSQMEEVWRKCGQ
jgi:sigma-B regulation protein RsbU (phosphoserine phosphatase)